MRSEYYIAAHSAEPPFAVDVTPKSAGWTESSLQVIELDQTHSADLTTGDNEVMIVPLTGGGTVECGGERFELSPRTSVFSGPADMVYLGIDQPYVLAGAGRFAICGARAGRALPTAGWPPPTSRSSCAVRAIAVDRYTTSAPPTASRRTR